MTLKTEIIATIWGTTPKDAEIVADKIISQFEKRIDSIKPAQGMEYHCVGSVTYAKDKMKEMLK